MPEAEEPREGERTRYGFWLIVIGVVAVLIAYGAAVARWDDPADVAAVVGSVTAVIGTLVGAFFGVQSGAEGKAQAEKARADAEARAMLLAAHLDPRVAARILSESPQPSTPRARRR
jgi:hypothetical protein